MVSLEENSIAVPVHLNPDYALSSLCKPHAYCKDIVLKLEFLKFELK